MRIFLGAALLYIAFAAPIKDEDTDIAPSFPALPQLPTFPAIPTVTEETPAQEEDAPTTSASPSISHDEYNAVMEMIEQEQEVRRKHSASEKAIQMKFVHELLRQLGIPEEATDEFLNAQPMMPYDAEKQARFLEFFKKWAPKEVPAGEPNAAMSDEERNEAAINGEDKIRATLRKCGVPEPAIAEFIREEFHLIPFSLDKYFDFHSWGRRWGLGQVSKFRWTAKDGGRLHLETPGEAWAVDVFDRIHRAQNVRENNQKVREMFAHVGLPEAAIDEFIVLGLTEEPHDERKQVLAMNWVMKWQFAFPGSRHMRDIRKEMADEVETIFRHTFKVATKIQEIHEDGVMTQEELHFLEDVVPHLSEFEQLLIEKVSEHVGKELGNVQPSIKDFDKEMMNKVAKIFVHTYYVAGAIKARELADVDFTREEIDFCKQKLTTTEFEQSVVQEVLDTVAKKIVKKYGIIVGRGNEAH